MKQELCLNIYIGNNLYDAYTNTELGDGYIRYYNGLQMCWGLSTNGTGGSSMPYSTATFAKPFISSEYPYVIASGYDGDYTCSLVAISNISVTIHHIWFFHSGQEQTIQPSESTNPDKVSYIAIGHWK